MIRWLKEHSLDQEAALGRGTCRTVDPLGALCRGTSTVLGSSTELTEAKMERMKIRQSTKPSRRRWILFGFGFGCWMIGENKNRSDVSI